jgi:eukaryotic-like serine/threonine-protein kinase
MSENSDSVARTGKLDGSARRSLKSERVSVAPERVAVSSNGAHASAVQEKFELHGLLGEGGMGSVFIAQDRSLGRVVALKVLRSEYSGDVDLLRRFALEAQVGAQLEHPNIVPLYSLEREQGGGPAIAMQLVEGTTMAEYIANAALAPREARAASGEYALKKRLGKLLGACDAMQFAHARGVIHRDLKPENIMLGAHHEVYVMDWGLARVTVAQSAGEQEVGDAPVGAPSGFGLASILEPNTASGSAATLDSAATVLGASRQTASAAPPVEPGSGKALKVDPSSAGPQFATQHGVVMGTYQYMPPEQAMGVTDKMGPAADQYALGLIVLELSTLRQARSFSSVAEAQSQALLNQRNGDDRDVDGRPLDPALLAIVERATQGEVGARYPSVEALAEDVRRFIRDEPVSVYREGFAKRALRSAARHPVGVMSALMLVLLLGAAAVVASFAESAASARRAAHDLAGIKRLLMAVQSRTHEVDVHLSDLALGVERVGGVAREILSHDTNPDPAAIKAIAEAPPPALTWSDRYQTDVSFHEGLITWAGRAQGAAPPQSLPALKRILAWQREALIDSLPPGMVAPTSAELEQVLAAGKAPLMRVALGLADGAYAQFPGRTVPDGYDLRKRQWYRQAVAASGLGWQLPVAGPAGKTLRLPVLLPLRRGVEVLGAVAADVHVEELAETLLLSHMPGFVDAYLATREGRVVVRRKLGAEVLRPGAEPDADLTLPVLANRTLAARLAAGEPGGCVAASGRLLMFVRMISPAWYYVAEFERAPYLSDDLRACASSASVKD